MVSVNNILVLLFLTQGMVVVGAPPAKEKVLKCDFSRLLPRGAQKIKNELKQKQLLKLGYKVRKGDEFIIDLLDPKDPSDYVAAKIDRYEHEDVIVEVMRPELRSVNEDGLPNKIRKTYGVDGKRKHKTKAELADEMVSRAEEGMENYMNNVRDSNSFAVRAYEDTGHFSETARKDIYQWGEEYAFAAENVNVYAKMPNGKKGKRRATIRSVVSDYEMKVVPKYPFYSNKPEDADQFVVIYTRGGESYFRNFHVPEGKLDGKAALEVPGLPSETYLSRAGNKVRFKRNALLHKTTVRYKGKAITIWKGEGQVKEWGIWAVSPDHAKETYAITIAHLIAHTHDPRSSQAFNQHGKDTYLIADPPKVYEGLGFGRTDYEAFEEGSWRQTDEPIHLDGSDWYVLKIDTEGSENILRNLHRHRPRYSEEETKEISAFLDSLIKAQAKRWSN